VSSAHDSGGGVHAWSVTSQHVAVVDAQIADAGTAATRAPALCARAPRSKVMTTGGQRDPLHAAYPRAAMTTRSPEPIERSRRGRSS